MRNWIVPVVIAATFISCNKGFKDVTKMYPEVRTVNAEVLSDGSSVKVTGEILSIGESEAIKYAGFCMDTLEHPAMRSNQIAFEDPGNGIFTHTFTKLEPNKTYYFRAWAANGNGYTIASNDVMVKDITIGADLIPCKPGKDSIIFTRPNGTTIKEKFTRIEKLEYGRFMAYTDLHYYDIQFEKNPVSGVYLTATQNAGAQNDRMVLRIDGIQVASNFKVYVKQISTGKIELSICEGKYRDGQEYTFVANLTTGD